MGFFDWLFGKRSEEWYQKELSKLLAKHEELRQRWIRVFLNLKKCQRKKDKLSVESTIKLAREEAVLTNKMRTIGRQITPLIHHIKRYGYRIPPEYFDSYTLLLEFRKQGVV